MARNIDTVIGDDIYFQGTLSFKKDLQINGRFRGQIESPGELVLGEGAQVEADIEIAALSVDGSLTGNVRAHKRVELSKTGRVKGDIHTPDLRVESGAKISGHCVMDA
ncbi:MAG: polymer-forming cytoskeletal protein [Leptospiraceae bacterium]|nr:polymer-forming cytoskeletal protein [Leptospiraceae bacterium]